MRIRFMIASLMALIASPTFAKEMLREEAYSVGVMMVASGECMDMVQTVAGETLADVVFSFANKDESRSEMVSTGQDDLTREIASEGRVKACAEAIERYPDLLAIEPSAQSLLCGTAQKGSARDSPNAPLKVKR